MNGGLKASCHWIHEQLWVQRFFSTRFDFHLPRVSFTSTKSRSAHGTDTNSSYPTFIVFTWHLLSAVYAERAWNALLKSSIFPQYLTIRNSPWKDPELEKRHLIRSIIWTEIKHMDRIAFHELLTFFYANLKYYVLWAIDEACSRDLFSVSERKDLR